MTPLRGGLVAAIALLVLEIAWHAGFAPARAAQFWPTLAIATVPLLPGLLLARHDLRRGVLVCGIVGLFYFAHGVSALWQGDAPRIAGALEVLLALAVIAATGIDTRRDKRARAAQRA